jgi:hypothetical protein
LLWGSIDGDFKCWNFGINLTGFHTQFLWWKFWWNLNVRDYWNVVKEGPGDGDGSRGGLFAIVSRRGRISSPLHPLPVLLPENKQLCWSSPILTLSHIWSITSYKHTTVACSFINSYHTAGVDRVKWTIIIIGLTLASNAWCNKVVSWHYSQCHLHKSENSWVTSESQ